MFVWYLMRVYRRGGPGTGEIERLDRFPRCLNPFDCNESVWLVPGTGDDE